MKDREMNTDGHKKFLFLLKETTMLKNLAIMIPVALLFFVTGCNIKTPEIRGVVLDAETKQPVENAWVTATLGIKTKTVAGDTYSYLSIDPPHTRTDKNGRFIIPSKKVDKPSFPVGFGTTVETFGVGVNTVDDRGGSISLIQFLGKDKADVTVYVKPEVRTEGEYFSHLQALYNYCLTGRFSVEVPIVKDGCDDWELNYVILKHEKYIEKYKNPEIIENPPYGISKFENIIHYSGIQRQLGNLLIREKAYENALNIFKQVKKFDEKHGLSFHLKEYELTINELKQILQEKKK